MRQERMHVGRWLRFDYVRPCVRLRKVTCRSWEGVTSMKISEEQTHSVKWLAGKESDADLPGLLHAWQLACREARAIDQPIHPLVDILANHHHGFASRGILRL